MTTTLLSGACQCGLVTYAIDADPLFRAHCHCLTCQAFNQADYADIVVVRSKHVSLESREKIKFRFHQRPPVINRGRCQTCDGATLEELNLPLFPKITIVPAQTLHSMNKLPPARFHMFYHRRIDDAKDDLPKHSSYVRSQLAFSSALLASLTGLNRP